MCDQEFSGQSFLYDCMLRRKSREDGALQGHHNHPQLMTQIHTMGVRNDEHIHESLMQQQHIPGFVNFGFGCMTSRAQDLVPGPFSEPAHGGFRKARSELKMRRIHGWSCIKRCIKCLVILVHPAVVEGIRSNGRACRHVSWSCRRALRLVGLCTVVRLEALRVLTSALYISLQSSFACFVWQFTCINYLNISQPPLQVGFLCNFFTKKSQRNDVQRCHAMFCGVSSSFSKGWRLFSSPC